LVERERGRRLHEADDREPDRVGADSVRQQRDAPAERVLAGKRLPRQRLIDDSRELARPEIRVPEATAAQDGHAHRLEEVRRDRAHRDERLLYISGGYRRFAFLIQRCGEAVAAAGQRNAVHRGRRRDAGQRSETLADRLVAEGDPLTSRVAAWRKAY